MQFFLSQIFFIMGLKSCKYKQQIDELSDIEIELLLQSTHFSRVELNSQYKGFINDYPNGRMNKKSFIKMFQEFAPAAHAIDKSNKFVEYVFK